MANTTNSDRNVRALSAALATAQPDAELVEEFVQRRDTTAFATLLKRHGPMVMRLCRRILPSEHEAEDVFQATFLVLARQAASLRKADSVGPWLYGVAYRIALKSRSARCRRERTMQLPDLTCSDDPLERLSVREAEKLLLEELARLPIKYRDPIVLCYLEGMTRDEAAAALKCSLGTLKDRLHRGKELLQVRLRRRGVSLSAAMLASLFSESFAPVELSASQISSVVQTATSPELPVTRAIAVLASAGATTGRMKLAVGVIAATVVLSFAAGIVDIVAAAPGGKAAPKEIAAGDPPGVGDPDPRIKLADSLGDPLPNGAIMRLGTHRHRVQSWQSLPDGRSYLAVRRGDVRRIDSKSGEVIESWSAPERLEIAGVSPDGRFMLMINHYFFYTGLRLPGQEEPKQEWRLTLYDLAKRKEVWSRRQMLSLSEWPNVRACSFAKSGRWIVLSGRRGKGSLRLWDAKKGKELWHQPGDAQSFDVLGFAEEEKLIVVRGQSDGHIRLVDRATGKVTRQFATASTRECPGGALLSPDGSQIVIGGWTPKPRVWNLDGKEQAPLEGHKEWARELAFSPDGKMLYSGGNDSFVLERSWPSGKVLRTIDLGRKGISQLAVSGDGERLEIQFWGEKAISFFDLETGKRIPEAVDGHRAPIYGIACAPDGSLVSFGCDATVRTWDLKTGKAAAQFKVELDLNAGGFALSADGKRVAVPKCDIDGIHIYERATGKLLTTIAADHWSMKKLAFSPDGRFLSAINTDAGVAQVWAIDTGKQVLKFQAKEVGYGSTAGAFSPDGRVFAFSDGGLARFWNTETWKEEGGIACYCNFGMAFSPDGRMLATASIEGVRIFEVASQREREYIRPNGGYPLGGLQFSKSGRYLAWVNDRAKAFVLDVRTGVVRGPFAGHDESISDFVFTSDEKALATSSADSTILIWDLANGAAKNQSLIGDTDTAWKSLASDDAKAAFAAIRTMAADPEKAIKRIRDRVAPGEPLGQEWVAARLRNLDSAKFTEREQSMGELEQAGERVIPHLEKMLQGKPSAEARERAERLLSKLGGPTDDRGRAVQMRRGLEVLEWIGTDCARALVEILAKSGDWSSSSAKDAKAALSRWRR
jgi:RNA polymerase sigma factor (sigma-70 family)